MGAYAPAPVATPEIMDRIMKDVCVHYNALVRGWGEEAGPSGGRSEPVKYEHGSIGFSGVTKWEAELLVRIEIVLLGDV